MKKILNMVAVSTLIGISASNLQLLVNNSVLSYDLKANKNINIAGEKNPFIPTQINASHDITNISIAPNGTVYTITDCKLNKSIDNGLTFVKVSSAPTNIACIAITPNGTIYLGATSLWKSNDNGSFDKVNSISDSAIWSLTVDKNGNIYAGSDNGTIYQCLAGQTAFKIWSEQRWYNWKFNDR